VLERLEQQFEIRAVERHVSVDLDDDVRGIGGQQCYPLIDRADDRSTAL
jgi:hypothetical protein